jgi:hypothetical protein
MAKYPPYLLVCDAELFAKTAPLDRHGRDEGDKLYRLAETRL